MELDGFFHDGAAIKGRSLVECNDKPFYLWPARGPPRLFVLAINIS